MVADAATWLRPRGQNTARANPLMSTSGATSGDASARERICAGHLGTVLPGDDHGRSVTTGTALSSPAAPVASHQPQGPASYTIAKRLKAFLTAMTCVLIIASIVTSLFIVQRQTTLKQVSRYNVTWLASQAPVELTRLEAAVLESTMPGSDIGPDQVQLRLDIVRNRISLLDNGEAGSFIRGRADLEATVARLRSMVDEAQPLIYELGSGVAAGQLLKLISPLGPQLVRLAAASNAHGGELVARDQAQLSHLHLILSGVIAGLTLCGFGLLGVVTWHNRLLQRAYAEVNILASSLNTHNARFDAALNNMSQALCMVDHEQRIIVCNVRFLELFGLPAGMAEPGMLIEDVFRSAVGLVRYQREMIEAICRKQHELVLAGRTSSFFEESSHGQAIAVSHQLMPASGWIATYEDISERRQAEARIYFMAHHDTLTSLPNRLLFEEKLGQTLKGVRREDGSAAVLCLDLDHFKNVNDTLGHPAGDRLLKEVAQRLLECVRDGDVVARLGGDEFVILQSSACQPEHAEALARRLIKIVSAPYDIDGTRVIIGTSVGIAVSTNHQNDTTHLLKNADIALYKAKAGGRGTFRLFEADMDLQLQARRIMGLDLREAVDRRELMLFYQPLFDLTVNKVTGFEALLRWFHPVRGMISPATFIPFAEETGLIARIGEWVLAQACHDAATWPKNIGVAVNLSPLQFQSDNLVRAVRSALEASGLSPRRLELEITESALLKDSNKVLATLHELRDLGAEIALDDFGTGYSSLSYLRSFPFDKIKIDQSFIREMNRRPDCMAIVHSITHLAQKLGMTTTAEGVETREQLDQVREAGCTQAQGYYFDRPRPASDVARWFTDPALELASTV